MDSSPPDAIDPFGTQMDSQASFLGPNSGFQIGYLNGSVYPNLRAEAEEAPQPQLMICYERDPDFIDPGSFVKQVHKLTSKPSSRIALVGLSGVGKSQILIEYAYQIREASPRTWVFWIDASDSSHYEQGLIDIANYAKIPRRTDPSTNIYELVCHWLQEARKDKWVLIIDSLNEDDFLHEPVSNGRHAGKRNDCLQRQGVYSNATHGKTPYDFLPRNPNGSIIFTSRSKRVASNLVHDCRLLSIEPLQSHALSLLRRKLGQKMPTDYLELQKLAKQLDSIPLAILQATKYISTHAPRYSVSQYVEAFQDSKKRARLLRFQAGQLQRRHRADSSIMVKLQSSFQFIQRTSPEAFNLLSLMSFFDPHGIPDYVLSVSINNERLYDKYLLENEEFENDELINEQSHCEGQMVVSAGHHVFPIENINHEGAPDRYHGQRIESKTDESFEEHVLVLRDNFLVSIGHDPRILQMPRLVHLSMQDLLETQGNGNHWRNLMIFNLHHAFPLNPGYENQDECRNLFPHILSAALFLPDRKYRLVWANVLLRGSVYAQAFQNGADARNLATRAREEIENLLSLENEKTLFACLTEAKACAMEGDLETAEGICRRVVEVAQKEYEKGQESDIWGDIVNMILAWGRMYLADIYHMQGGFFRNFLAEKEYKRVHDLRRASGEADAILLNSSSNLAFLYASEGHFDDAEALLKQVLMLRRTHHPNAQFEQISDIQRLCTLYEQQNNQKKVVIVLEEAFEQHGNILKPERPETLVLMIKLANALRSQKETKKAIGLLEKVLKAQKVLLERGHNAIIQNTLALTVWYQEERMGKELVSLLTEAIGPHGDSIDMINPRAISLHLVLAKTFQDQGKHQEAVRMLEQIFQSSAKTFGREDWRLLLIMKDLAHGYYNLGRFQDSEAILWRKFLAEINGNGEFTEHMSNTLECFVLIAKAYLTSGQGCHAERLLEKILEYHTVFHGKDHISTLRSRHQFIGTLLQPTLPQFSCMPSAVQPKRIWLQDALLVLQDILKSSLWVLGAQDLAHSVMETLLINLRLLGDFDEAIHRRMVPVLQLNRKYGLHYPETQRELTSLVHIACGQIADREVDTDIVSLTAAFGSLAIT